MAEKFDQLKGKAKEAAGKVTGDKKTETEGKAENLGGKIKEAVNDLKDSAEGAIEGVKESLSKDKDEENK
ncbi:MAG: CsbD family protein [Aerococcus sp.]|nr:CsbD family protein [Aerococcus sp.]